MEEYFDALSFRYTNWSDVLEKELDIKSNSTCKTPEPNVQLLPRQDVSLYGIIPKMETRSFFTCKECKQVFNLRNISSHKNCSSKEKAQLATSFKKKVNSKKKQPQLSPMLSGAVEDVLPIEEFTSQLHQNPVYLVNANELPENDAPVSLLPKHSPLVENVREIGMASKFSSSIPLEEPFTPDYTMTSSSIEKSSKLSIRSNSHSRSKSKKRKHRESVQEAQYSLVDQNESYETSIMDTNHEKAESFKKPDSNLKEPSARSNTSTNNTGARKPYYFLESEYLRDHGTLENFVPVMYLAMSPVSATSPAKVDEEELDIDSDEVLTPMECPPKIFISVSESLNVKMYKTRPKLGSFPFCGARKIGGAIVISNQKLLNQRRDILCAMTSKHEPKIFSSETNQCIDFKK